MKTSELANWGVAIDPSGAEQGATRFDAATKKIEQSAQRGQATVNRMEGAFTSAGRAMKTAEVALKGFERQYEARMATVREELARGFITEQEAERQGREAALAYNRGVLGAIDRRAATGALEGYYGRAQYTELASSLKTVSAASTGAHMGMGRLKQELTTAARIAVGANPVFGQLGAMLATFAVGTTATLGILAGIAAIGFAWQKLTEDSRNQRAENDKMVQSLRTMEHELSEHAKKVRIASLEARLGAITDEIGARGDRDVRGGVFGWGDIVMNWQSMFKTGELTAEQTKIIARLGELRNALSGDRLDSLSGAAKKAGEDMHEAIRKSRDELDQWATDFYSKLAPSAAEVQKQLDDALKQQGEEIDKFLDPQKEITEEFNKQLVAARLLIMAAEGNEEAWQRVLDGMKAASDQTAQMKDIVIGIGAGIGSRMGGPLGGILSGAISGIPGGGIGIAAGAVQGLVSSIIGLGDSAKQQEEKIRALKQQYVELSDQLSVLLGTMGSVEARQRAITREYAAHRDELERGIAATEEFMRTMHVTAEAYRMVSGSLDRMRAELEAINAVEGTRIDILKEEIRQYNETMQQDLEVRRLRAIGRKDEADALELALKQQREYAEAMTAGADATTLAALAETQRVEKISLAMTKIQERIDSLTATITGLQTFRNSLLLSAVRSPTDQYAEARRQYNEILAAAQGGDQAAAGQLPGAAQAFLDASRAVNASGSAFQADFQRVLNETQALIQQFKDQRSVEELMLDELRRIRDNTAITAEGWEQIFTPAGGVITLGGSGGGFSTPEVEAELHAQVAVLQEGFTQTIERLDTLNQKLDDNTAQTRRSLEGLVLGRVR